MKKGKLRLAEGGMLYFYCPGCKCHHLVCVEGEGHPAWSFNGDYEKPTFSPSILVKSGHYVPNSHPDECWCNFEQRFPEEGPAPYKCGICHSFVTNGKIQFLSDCTHELAGQTVDMADPEH